MAFRWRFRYVCDARGTGPFLALACRGRWRVEQLPEHSETGLEPAARVTRVGVTQLPQCGTNDEVLAHHGLDVAGLAKALRQAVPQIA